MRMIQIIHTNYPHSLQIPTHFWWIYEYWIESFIIIVSMIAKQKKVWSKEEDIALKKMYEEEGEQSWSIIAKRLAG